MAINYADKHAGKIDEVLAAESITDVAVNKDYDFTGVRTIKIHSVPTVGMNDYTRSGLSRYGMPSELEDNVQEVSCTQDRSFTFTVDKGNSEEDAALNAGRATERQLKQVVAPERDKYRLGVMVKKAQTTLYGAYKGNGATGPYECILDLNKAVDDNNAPGSGRVCFVSSAFRKALKLDANFVKASDMAQEMLIKGQIGEVDGLPILKDCGRLPKGVAALVTHPIATTAPNKLAEEKLHIDPPGISGALVEGRYIYDAFVLDNKACCIAVLRGELAALTVTNAAGASGKTKFTDVSGHKQVQLDMGTLCYKIASTVAAPALGDDLSNTTTYHELMLGADIAATASHKYVVCLKDAAGKCIGVSAVGTVAVGA